MFCIWTQTEVSWPHAMTSIKVAVMALPGNSYSETLASCHGEVQA